MSRTTIRGGRVSVKTPSQMKDEAMRAAGLTPRQYELQYKTFYKQYRNYQTITGQSWNKGESPSALFQRMIIERGKQPSSEFVSSSNLIRSILSAPKTSTGSNSGIRRTDSSGQTIRTGGGNLVVGGDGDVSKELLQQIESSFEHVISSSPQVKQQLEIIKSQGGDVVKNVYGFLKAVAESIDRSRKNNKDVDYEKLVLLAGEEE